MMSLKLKNIRLLLTTLLKAVVSFLMLLAITNLSVGQDACKPIKSKSLNFAKTSFTFKGYNYLIFEQDNNKYLTIKKLKLKKAIVLKFRFDIKNPEEFYKYLNYTHSFYENNDTVFLCSYDQIFGFDIKNRKIFLYQKMVLTSKPIVDIKYSVFKVKDFFIIQNLIYDRSDFSGEDDSIYILKSQNLSDYEKQFVNKFEHNSYIIFDHYSYTHLFKDKLLYINPATGVINLVDLLTRHNNIINSIQIDSQWVEPNFKKLKNYSSKFKIFNSLKFVDSMELLIKSSYRILICNKLNDTLIIGYKTPQHDFFICKITIEEDRIRIMKTINLTPKKEITKPTSKPNSLLLFSGFPVYYIGNGLFCIYSFDFGNSISNGIFDIQKVNMNKVIRVYINTEL